MSRLAHAGESSTVSPGRAACAAAPTAAGSVAQVSSGHTPASARARSGASRPISTAWRTLPRKAAASGAKSWFLPSPPAIITSGPGSPATAALVNARLGGGVARELGVAVEMIGADVEHRGGAAGEALRRLELEARELEHVELGAAAEESERGLPEVAPGAHPHSRALRHTGEQRRDGALAVGVGDAGDRSIDCAREELDVADDAEPAAA